MALLSGAIVIVTDLISTIHNSNRQLNTTKTQLNDVDRHYHGFSPLYGHTLGRYGQDQKVSHNCLKEMEGIYAVWFILEATQETMKEDTFIRGTPKKASDKVC